jgi:uncharacterized UBP type Zn finger protein
MMWKCGESSCGTREDVVVCLTCAWMGCGRNQPGQHALKHFKATSHALTMLLNTGETFCYTCDEWVVNDNFKGDIEVVLAARSTDVFLLLTCSVVWPVYF